jgi:outer membrane receptor protein involved in Fe transport
MCPQTQYFNDALFLKNLLYTRYYYPVTQTDSDDTAIPGAGRTFKVGLDYKF